MALTLIAASSSMLGFIRSQAHITRISSHQSPNINVVHVKCMAAVPTKVRRSANYRPPIWGYGFVQSLESNNLGESHTERAVKLMEEVKRMLEEVIDPLDKLELVDTLQRLGISYHFEHETKTILENISADSCNFTWKKDNLYATALEFRLLRQHGYNVSQVVFTDFMDDEGNFKASLREDCKGMLNLYEASYFSLEGESILSNARNFVTEHLKEYMKQNEDLSLSMLVDHALELPLHWTMPRLEARWFIDLYEKRQDKNLVLLELAKLDFNMVQAVHQADLKYAAKWWKDAGLAEHLSFARDRLMGNFLWTVGMVFDPQYRHCRRTMTKIISLIGTLDDIYDVYGTLDELELFTEAVERWDIMNAMEELPHYMKIFFLALHNCIHGIAFEVLNEQGFNIIPYLKKMWADLCKSYLLEARWYYSGYTPTLQEYMDNSWVSVAVPVALAHAYVLVTNPISKKSLEFMEEYPNIIRWSSIIFRLADDLGTSSDELKRGDVPKSIQCYMHETGASEEAAREHIRNLIEAAWKKMNGNGIAKSLVSQTCVEFAMNLARMALFMYPHGLGDGHGVADREAKDIVSSLLFQPIS